MAEKQVTVETVEENDAVARAKGFWAKFSKPIIYVGSAIIILAGGWFGYKYFIALPNQQKASELIFPAEKIFGIMSKNSNFPKDSVNLVINGSSDPSNKMTGLLTIINKYGSTPAGNLAQYMVGACYLHTKEFDKAIKYLKDFDGHGANQVQSKAYILLGDAYAEQKKTDDAFGYYKKAGDILSDKDEQQKVFAMYTAASYADYIGKSKDAIDILKDIRDNFSGAIARKGQYEPQPSVTKDEVEKLLAKLGVTN
jgi:predicted negative regulator of RcsB-dependent stress response